MITISSNTWSAAAPTYLKQYSPDPGPVPLTNSDHVDAEDLVYALGGERVVFQSKVQFALILDSCQLLASARRYSTAPTKAKDSNLGLYLIGAGTAGLGAYAYLNSLTPSVQAVKLKETSPLDPSNFVDFELKRVDHYNHNTAK